MLEKNTINYFSTLIRKWVQKKIRRSLQRERSRNPKKILQLSISGKEPSKRFVTQNCQPKKLERGFSDFALSPDEVKVIVNCRQH